ncbi:MAG: right-handed parallel beta-helix repeat-containing protein [Planctomycetia bacterium]|nr:right-handed parallel beta-helix repeat-containing protein [Planctomycetia bacterium]
MISPASTRKLTLERLEDRRLLTIYVDTGNDYETGCLRYAITQSNLTAGHDTIEIQDQSNNFSHIYLDSALPTITDGVTIYTESGNTVFIHCEDYDGPGLFVEITQSNRSKAVSFTDLEVANVTGAAFELSGDELENAALSQCIVHGSHPDYEGNEGILITATAAEAITITDCNIFRKETGIWLDGHVDSVVIDGATISAPSYAAPDPDWYGIRCDGTGNVLIQDCEVYNIPGTGIHLNGYGSSALQAQITGSFVGVTATNDPGPIGINGIDVENWRGTIDPLDDSHVSYLLQNTIANCGGSGVQITNSLSVSLALNTIHDSDGNGIAIASDGTGESSDVLLFDNAIHDNDGNGVAIISDDYAESSDIRLLDNTIQDNGGDGILLSAVSYGTIDNIVVGDSTFSSYNVIENNVGHGISFIASGAGAISGVDVIYNAIANNAPGAIVVDDANCLYDVSNAYFYGNYFVDSLPPIDLGEDSNHGLDAPVINADEVRLYEYESAFYWIVPFSLEAGATFGDEEFCFQLYEVDPVTHEYVHVADVTATLASDGSCSSVFALPAAYFTAGDQVKILASCVETCAQMGDTSEFSNEATIQDAPPKVVGVQVGNGSVSETFAPAVDSDAQLWTVRMPTVTTVSITFSRDDVETDATALTVVNSTSPPTTTIAAASLSWSADRHTATWTLDSEVPAGEWYIVLDAAGVLTPEDTPLDGEWTNPANFGDNDGNDTFPSGNEVAGGEFKFAFTVLPGDADRDGDVDGIDLSNFADGWYGIQPPSWQYGDFDGDEDVDGTDLSIFAVGWYLDPNVYWRAPEGEGMLMAGDSLESENLRTLVDELFRRHGFGDDDATNDMGPSDARWDACVDDLFDVLEFELAA